MQDLEVSPLVGRITVAIGDTFVRRMRQYTSPSKSDRSQNARIEKEPVTWLSMHTANQILTQLHEHRDDRYKETVVRLGIPRENSIGVSIKILRQLAKQITPNNELAHGLWQTGYHEARLLSVLIADPYSVDPAWAIALMDDVVSWDLCDHLCKNLLFTLPEYQDLIFTWQHDERLYHKRAAFSLIASSVIHEKDITVEQVEEYLSVIEQHESDGRTHVKKAISWALREIGKNDIAYHPKALAVARALADSDDKNRRWVGKDALREIEQLVPVKGRKRLVSRKTKSGKESEGNTKKAKGG